MNGEEFVNELAAANQKALNDLNGGPATAAAASPGVAQLLRVALSNEISVAELAAVWMPSVQDWEMKIALARQAGDEARHFELVRSRLEELGVSVSDFQAPPVNPLFEYLRALNTPVERIAAGMFTLESIAFFVNEEFLRHAEAAGDHATAKIYRDYIQPDEKHHHELGKRLLERLASDEESQRLARNASQKTLELARSLRHAAKQRMGTACLPGC